VVVGWEYSSLYSKMNECSSGNYEKKVIWSQRSSRSFFSCPVKAHEAVIRSQYPAPEETLQFLAALRLQYLLGDHSSQANLPEMSQVFPMARLRTRVENSAKTFAPGTGSVADRSGTAERKRSSFLEGTLRRSFRSGSLSRQKLEEENSLEAWMREEAVAVKTSVMDKWKKLQGMNQEQAMVKYMALAKEWRGYGSTLFNVEVRTSQNRFYIDISVSGLECLQQP